MLVKAAKGMTERNWEDILKKNEISLSTNQRCNFSGTAIKFKFQHACQRS